MSKRNQHLIRALKIKDGSVDQEKRTVLLSFSSELPYERWYGNEILSHAPGAVDLSRMKDGANVLFNHNWDEYVGVVDSAYIGDDKRGYCEVRFSDNELGTQMFKDVSAGIIRNVSVGYEIGEMILSRQGEDINDYTATQWTPYEVSFCTVAADPTVGVGRNAETCENERLKSLVQKANTDATMAEAYKKTPIAKAIETIATKIENETKETETPAASPAIEEQRMSQEDKDNVLKEERARVRAIEAITERHDMKDFGRELIEKGTTIEDARAQILEKMQSRGVSPVAQGSAAGGEIGLSEKETRSYSFLKAIRAQMFPNDKKFQEAAAMEREISEATCKATGKTARGILIPFDVLNQRDVAPQQVAQAPLGGNLVQNTLRTDSFIDLLRNESALIGSGAQVLTGLDGTFGIPRATQASTAYWVGEGQDVPLSDVMFDQINFSPKTVGVYTEYTRKLMLQGSLDIENYLRKDMAETLALELDRAALYGTGTGNMPRGIKNQPGISVVTGGSAPSYEQIIDMETAVAVANGNIGATKYIFGASLRGALKKKPIAPGGYPLFLLGPDGKLNGYDNVVSNQVAASDIFFGVWSQMIMAFWSGLDVVVDPYSKATSGNVRIVVMQDADIGVRQPKCFSVSTYA